MPPSTYFGGSGTARTSVADVWAYQAGHVTPTVSSETPASGAANVAVSTGPTATFSEPVQVEYHLLRAQRSTRHDCLRDRQLFEHDGHGDLHPQRNLGRLDQLHSEGQRGQDPIRYSDGEPRHLDLHDAYDDSPHGRLQRRSPW